MSELTRRRPFALALAAIVLAALALRIAHILAIARSPAGDTLVEDAAAYQATALALIGRAPATAGPSFLNVGYPYALAAVYTVAGPHVVTALAVQAIASALSLILLALASRDLFESPLAGCVTAAALALYRPGVFYDGLLLTPSLTNAAVCLSLFAIVRGTSRRSHRPLLWLGAAGAAAGAAALLRPNVLLLAPVLAVAVAWRVSAGARLRAAGALLLGTLALIAPVLVAERAAHDAWIPLSTNAGMNFWTGNHRGASGAYAPAEFVDEQNAEGERKGFLDEARRRTGDPSLSLAASSAFWRSEAWRDVRADPGGWLALEARKALLFGSELELRTNVSMGFHERLSAVLRFMPFGFPILLAAGCAGLALLLLERRWIDALVVGSTAAVALATCTLFFVSGEYRHLAAPGLALGAGAIFGTRSSRRGRRIAALAVLVVALCGSHVDAPADLAAASDPAIDDSNVARAICLEGKPPGDPAALRRAERLLDGAPAASPKRVYVLDARFWVRLLAAREGSREAVVAALDAADGLIAALPELSSSTYSGAFRSRVRSSVVSRLERIAANAAVDADPELHARVADLLARARRS